MCTTLTRLLRAVQWSQCAVMDLGIVIETFRASGMLFGGASRDSRGRRHVCAVGRL